MTVVINNQYSQPLYSQPTIGFRIIGVGEWSLLAIVLLCHLSMHARAHFACTHARTHARMHARKHALTQVDDIARSRGDGASDWEDDVCMRAARTCMHAHACTHNMHGQTRIYTFAHACATHTHTYTARCFSGGCGRWWRRCWCVPCCTALRWACCCAAVRVFLA